MAAVVFAAFTFGRWFERTIEVTRPNPARQTVSVGSPQLDARERALLIAVGAHLERAQIALTELANAKHAESIDISLEQDAARVLLPDNRIYRQTAVQLGDAQVATLLDELERLLVDLSHLPPSLSTAELRDIRERIEQQGLLFKIRIAGSDLRNRQFHKG
jgi:hypothetical protein